MINFSPYNKSTRVLSIKKTKENDIIFVVVKTVIKNTSPTLYSLYSHLEINFPPKSENLIKSDNTPPLKFEFGKL